MNLPNKPKVLAATYNSVSNTKMISFLVDFPTVLLAELRTHRILTQGSLYEHSELVDFNLSANSARAIPHNKYLQKVLDNPFIPIWTKQQKGMSGDLLENIIIKKANQFWYQNLKDKDTFYSWLDNEILCEGYKRTMSEEELLDIDEFDINICKLKTLKSNYEDLIQLGVHKQNANRLLAPFAYTTCIISGTEWDNFFTLRLSKDAQPEFKEVALMLKELYDKADWKESKYHIPFEEDIEKIYKVSSNFIYHDPEGGLCIDEKDYKECLMKISASMCAKLSYNTQDNEDTLEKHLERANMLIEHKHQEPFSHQAIAMNEDEYEHMFTQSIVNVNGKKEIKREMGVAYNLRGFISYRYILENY